jgi:hypothetical protein
MTIEEFRDALPTHQPSYPFVKLNANYIIKDARVVGGLSGKI